MIGYSKAKKILEKSRINIGLQNVSFLDSLNRIPAEINPTKPASPSC